MENLEDRCRHGHVTTLNDYLSTQALSLHLTSGVKILLNLDVSSLNETRLQHEKLCINTVQSVSNQNIMMKVHQILYAGQTVQHKSVTSDYGTVPDAVVFRRKENMLLKHATFGC